MALVNTCVGTSLAHFPVVLFRILYTSHPYGILEGFNDRQLTIHGLPHYCTPLIYQALSILCRKETSYPFASQQRDIYGYPYRILCPALLVNI